MWDAVASELATVPIHQQLCLENYFSRPSELSSQGAVPISPAPWDGRAFWWYQQPVCISKSHFPQLYAAGGLHRVVGGSWVSPVLPCRLPLFEIKPGRRVQSLSCIPLSCPSGLCSKMEPPISSSFPVQRPHGSWWISPVFLPLQYWITEDPYWIVTTTRKWHQFLPLSTNTQIKPHLHGKDPDRTGSEK